MHVRRLLMLLALVAALLMGCSGYATMDYYDDPWDRSYYRSSDCPRYWIIGPLDCRSCHWEF